MEWFIIIGLVFANLLSYFFGFIKGLRIERPEFIQQWMPKVTDILNHTPAKQFAILPSHREKEELKRHAEGIPSIQDVLKDQL